MCRNTGCLVYGSSSRYRSSFVCGILCQAAVRPASQKKRRKHQWMAEANWSVRFLDLELQMKIENLEKTGANNMTSPGHMSEGVRVCALCRGNKANRGMTCHRAPGTYRMPATEINVCHGLSNTQTIAVIKLDESEKPPIAIRNLRPRILRILEPEAGEVRKQHFTVVQGNVVLGLYDKVYSDKVDDNIATLSLVYQANESLLVKTHSGDLRLAPEFMEIKVCEECLPELDKYTY